ncbi:MAG: DUF4932 domain-containing protein [Candidatus Cryptobacteroides sp.]
MTFIKRIIPSIFGLIISVLMSAAGVADINSARPGNIPVKYIEETELVGVLCHLAGINGYCFGAEDGVLEDYLKDVDSTFAGVKEHKAVVFAREKLARKGFGWDFPMAFALRLRLENGRLIYNEKIEKNFDDYYCRISRKDEKTFIKLLEDFYDDSGFGRFFAGHKALYEECENAMKEVVSGIDLSWYDRFFGRREHSTFNICLGLLNGGGNYAVHQMKNDGSDIINAVMGCCDRDENGNIYYGAIYTLPILIHEFNHSYCNPLNNEFWSEIAESAGKLFSKNAKFYASIAYGSPELMMDETFVEACMMRYLMKHPLDLDGTGFKNMDELLERLIDIDETDKKFILIRDIIDALQEREDNYDKYPEMRDFMPVYAARVNRACSRE